MQLPAQPVLVVLDPVTGIAEVVETELLAQGHRPMARVDGHADEHAVRRRRRDDGAESR